MGQFKLNNGGRSLYKIYIQFSAIFIVTMFAITVGIVRAARRS